MPSERQITQPIYLDYNAATPIDPRALETMLDVLKNEFGNPSSEHSLGLRASAILDRARAQVAAMVHCSPSEIVFTSGATESCNLAIRGAVEIYKERGCHIIACMTEHKSVLLPCKKLANEGFDVTFLRPDMDGRMDAANVEQALTDQTILVCVMAANNVTGVINPIGQIAQLCKKRGIIFFCDATQAVGKIPFNVEDLKPDLVAFSSHKMYGPKGTGALYIRSQTPRVRLNPLLLGGKQERGLRGGTENVAGIAAMAKACEVTQLSLAHESLILTQLRDRLEQGLLRQIPGARALASQADRLPNTTNIYFPDIDAGRLLRQVPQIAASTGAACDSSSGDSNYVLKAMGVEDGVAAGCVRFSIGRFTTAQQIDTAIDLITAKVNRSSD